MLYETVIVRFNVEKKTLKFDSGKWRTRATLNWTNRFLTGLDLAKKVLLVTKKDKEGKPVWSVVVEGQEPIKYKDNLIVQL